MATLSHPVYEVKQDTKWYKEKLKWRKGSKQFFEDLDKDYGIKVGFHYYHSTYFGMTPDCTKFEEYRDQLTKNANKDGIYTFKKTSKMFKELSERIKAFDLVYAFQHHDELGLNNVTRSQWLDDRWFFEVKNEKFVEGNSVELIDYKEYLKFIVDSLEN